MTHARTLELDDLEPGRVVMIVGPRRKQEIDAGPMAVVVDMMSRDIMLKGRPLRVKAVALPFVAVTLAEVDDADSVSIDTRDVEFVAVDDDYLAALRVRRRPWWKRLFVRR